MRFAWIANSPDTETKNAKDTPHALFRMQNAILECMRLILLVVSNLLRWLTLAASILVIGLSLLLFVQWPLRDWLQAYSRQANDVGQILFALYACFAITAASQTKTHLAMTKHGGPATQPGVPWHNWTLLLCLAPWALFLMWTAAPQMLASIAQLESFSEGNTPGYFFLRIALVLLPVFVLLEALHSVFANPGQQNTDAS